ncbi:aldehyde dehydrogenase [Angustibacter sp. Root456]|uniref:aldehyde dehydrogenase family protein n=1 Tax=Angustibacter sp. Root456 TaxID=1736539 RepID=UPI000A689211|nr:aldehyde dehydrogenase family protein [Angustibacter sp. Root456]
MIVSRSPQQPTDVVVEVAATEPAQVEAAVARARAAQRGWAQAAAPRAAALHAAADLVATRAEQLEALVVREVGKPRAEARGEVARTAAILRYYAEQVFDPVGAVHEPSLSGLLLTQRRPHGVAGLITPWNFPLAIPLWKAAPALAFGNTVVLKPAPEATACALALAEILDQCLPPDVFTVVPGEAQTGQALVQCADVVSFTGSVGAGGAVAAAAGARGVPVQAEMGGQNPAVVLPDADAQTVASHLTGAAMGYAGQKCTATKRIIVVGDPGPLREALVAAVEALPVGDPARAETVVGPVINEGARQRVQQAAASARAAGGRLLTGTRSVSDDGWYVAPTLVEGVPASHELACEEVFGPICLLQQASDVDQAVAMANGVRFGLAAGLYTNDLDAVLALTGRLEAGLVKVNAPTSGVDFYLPFGGEKASSLGGREQGKAAQDFYTSVHTVTIARP